MVTLEVIFAKLIADELERETVCIVASTAIVSENYFVRVSSFRRERGVAVLISGMYSGAVLITRRLVMLHWHIAACSCRAPAGSLEENCNAVG